MICTSDTGAGSSGTYNLSGSGLLSAPSEYIGYSGSARASAGTLRNPGKIGRVALSGVIRYNKAVVVVSFCV